MKVGPAVKRLHAAELDLADEYRKIGERQPSDHVYHRAHAFASECRAHVQRLEPIAERYGSDLDDGGGDAIILELLRRKTGELVGRRPESGALLLRDLRELYLAAQETLIAWVIVRQGAMAARDAELIAVAKACQPETELQMKWLLSRTKETAPQALTS